MKPLIDATLVKKCNRCSEIKHIYEYHPNKQCTLGVVGTCKACHRGYISKWYSDNRRSRQDAANKRNRERKEEMVNLFGRECHDCKGTFPNCVFQFHHLDPSVKDINPSGAMTRSREKMLDELPKCVMLCANCHIVRHFGKEGVNESTY